MFKTITLEGQDQAGKGDATLNLAKKLVGENFSILSLSLPFYSAPIGTLIRLYYTDIERFNTNPHLKKIAGKKQQTEIVGALFTLNRLEVLTPITSLANQLECDFVLSDRGAYSMAVSIAYAVVSGMVDNTEIPDMIEKFLNFDALYRTTLLSDLLIIQLKSNGKVSKVAQGERREAESDIYESVDVQRITKEVHKEYGKKLTFWNEVVTRYDTEDPDIRNWRDRGDILDELWEIVQNSLENDPHYKQSANSTKQKGQNTHLTPADVASIRYGISISKDDQNKWVEAANINDKETLFTLSTQIGLDIASECDSSSLKWTASEAKTIRQLLEVYPLIEAMFDEYLPGKYYQKLQDSLNEPLLDNLYSRQTLFN